jgi:hypothetical protein
MVLSIRGSFGAMKKTSGMIKSDASRSSLPHTRAQNRTQQSGALFRSLRPWGLTSRRFHTPESRQAQALERGASRSAAVIGHNDQFKNADIG